MKTRAIIGIIACLLGALWISQGLSSTHSGGMNGHKQYAVLGAVVVLVGLGLLAWAWRIRGAARQKD
jgi:protein-S-isoprenylcysteine O-methyltransferase Ste14